MKKPHWWKIKVKSSEIYMFEWSQDDLGENPERKNQNLWSSKKEQ